MDANALQPSERIPASRKLGKDRARELAKTATKLIVSRGKSVKRFAPKGKPSSEMIEAMLGSTGNLRAPTLVVGKTVLVGFNEGVYDEVFG